MPAFTLDHIVIQTLDREAFVAEIAGLVLDETP